MCFDVTILDVPVDRYCALTHLDLEARHPKPAAGWTDQGLDFLGLGYLVGSVR